MQNNQNPDKLTGWLISLGDLLSPRDVGLEEKFKRVFAGIVVIATAPVLYAYGVFHIILSDYFFGSFLSLSALILTVSMLEVRKFREAVPVFRLNMVFVGILFLLLLSLSPPHGYMGLWIYVYPLMAFMLLRRKEGMVYTLILFSLMVLYFIFQDHLWNGASHDWGFISRFLLSFALVSLLAYSFEEVRGILHRRLIAEQQSLSEESEKLLKAKKVAETANRAKSDFLANMSHELRTPLNHILGFTELVVDEQFGDLNDTQKEYLNDSLQSGRHLLSLINDILDLSKIEAGKLELETSQVNLKKLLENSLILIKEKALKHGIQISLDYNGIPTIIKADERMLKQIMYNLLSNAAKFTSAGGEIRIKAKRVSENPDDPTTMKPGGNSFVEIAVEDTGIGIKTNDLMRIFRPFEQVESTSSRKFAGTGLGLSLVKNFVELHGGQIRAESEGEGKGSTFRFTLACE